MRKGKFIVSILTAAALLMTSAFAVSAADTEEPDSRLPIVQEEVPVSTGHVIPSADPNFVEMTLDEFQELYPDYEGVFPEDDGDISPLALEDPGYVTAKYDGPFEWVQEGSKWYLYSGTGSSREKVTLGGWYQDGNYWYCLYPSGATKYDGTTATGEMITGWEKIRGYWYYFNEYGQMSTYWKEVSGVYYYFSPSGADAISGYPQGAMATGAQYIPYTKGSSYYRNYYFSASGAMQDWYYPLSTSYLTLSSCFNDPRSNGNHQGIDIPAPAYTKITSATSGTVYQKGSDLDTEDGMGYYCKANTGILGHRNRNLAVIYMHMVEPCTLTQGASITQGVTTIGYVGSTGASTGNHLHFQVTYKGDMGTTALSNSVNPSAFFSETLVPNANCDVPAYGRDYNYSTGEFDE